MLDRFNRVVHGPWTTSGFDVQWRWDAARCELDFQCTRSWIDWAFNLLPYSLDYQGARVYAGYAYLWESVKSEVVAAVGDAVPSIGGFSLGGALAQHAHRHFLDRGPQSIIFGSPKAFISRIDLPGLVNVQTYTDIVPWAWPGGETLGELEMIGRKGVPGPWGHGPDAYRKAMVE